MSNDKLQFLSPLFLKYQSDFEKNPRSRVFAPLAESYRKIGMTDKAMEILSQGIRYNPGYVMGYMGLAFCYFDLKQYNLAYSTLRPLVESNRDNIRLQRLFADTCIAINHQDEALETLKYLLFINPRDKEIAKLVSTLEAEVEEQYKPQHKPIVIPAEEFSTAEDSTTNTLFDVDKLNSTPKIDFDDWLHIDFAQTQQTNKKSDDIDGWSVQKLNTVEKSSIETKPEPVVMAVEEETSKPILNLKTEEAPIVTHTLVDLYCGQGHVEKALELLEKILLLNPTDQKTIEKIQEIKSLMMPEPIVEETRAEIVELEEHDDVDDDVDMSDEDEILNQITDDNSENLSLSTSASLVDIEALENVTEEDGRRNLMNILDEKILSINENPLVTEIDEPKTHKKEELQRKLGLFLKRIHEKALDYQNRF